MRRSLAALVLLLLVVVVVYVWLDRSGGLRARPITAPSAGEVREETREIGDRAREGAREAAEGARAFGSEARERLAEAGHELKDAKVTASVKTALSLNRSLRPLSIDVGTENGVVTLKGRVNNQEERAKAESVAAAVPDVRQVVNQLQVGAGGPSASSGRSLGERFDDERIEVGVKLAFSLNRELDGTDLTVQSYRGQVTLGGEVATEAQRQRALQISRDTSSVSSVTDNIRVRASAAPAVVSTGASPSARAAAAQQALRSNPHLAPFNLQVQEEGGRVVVRGAVSTAIQKDLAVALARQAAGGNVEDAVEVRAGV